MQYIWKWLRRRYNLIVNSIAFYPAVIATGFLILSYVMLEIDFSEFGKNLKANVKWISLRDASTARAISSTIAAGILSLAVFSFSMVMILLNQTASSMSNRLLNSLIGNPFQQTVLGSYIGTIVYSLFLLSTIRDIDSGIYVPALSIYLLILLTVIDIFLFLYFIHYITQSVKYDTIIQNIYNETLSSLQHYCTLDSEAPPPLPDQEGIRYISPETGYYQGIVPSELAQLCKDEDCVIQMLHPPGTYLLKGSPLFLLYGKSHFTTDWAKRFMTFIDFYRGQSIRRNSWYGFEQLTEVAIRALSPGINDPGTALLCIHALSDLLAYRMRKYPETGYTDKEGTLRVVTKERSFEEIFHITIYPIWDYGKNDRKLMLGMQEALTQLESLHPEGHAKNLIAGMLQMVNTSVSRIEQNTYTSS